MTRCKEFYEKVRRDGNFCGMNKQSLENVEEYLEFLDKNPTLIGISERAVQPLIREKDPVIQAKAIEKVRRGLTKGQEMLAKNVDNIVEAVEAGKNVSGRPKTPQVPSVLLPPRGNDEYGDGVKGLDVEEDSYNGDTPDMPDTPDTQETSDWDDEKTYERRGGIDKKEVQDIKDQKEGFQEDEEKGWNNSEITQKVIKEYLVNAGHKDEVKPERIPSEEDKIALAENFVRQMHEWGVGREEIMRRVEKALIFVK